MTQPQQHGTTEKIRDDLREVIGEFEEYGIENEGEAELLASRDYFDGLIDGICHALGILRGNEWEVERRWAEAEYRETKRREKEKKENMEHKNEL